MGGRRRTVVRRGGSAKTRASSIMTEYYLVKTSMDFLSLASGAEKTMILADNDVRFGSTAVRIVKLKAQMWWDRNVSEERSLLFAVMRQTEGATALRLDNEDEVRNATQAGQFYRRPYVTSTMTSNYGSGGHMDHFLKPLILKNVLLDKDDDLVLAVTNEDSSFAGSSQQLQARIECWWKKA